MNLRQLVARIQGTATPVTEASVRAVLVKVTPAPTTLSERRAVLGVLKKYAEIDVFKKLHDPSHFVSITSQPRMADTLIAKSPLEFDLAARPNRTLPTPLNSIARPDASPHKTFRVKITEHSHYPHKTRIRENPTYGRWLEHLQRLQIIEQTRERRSKAPDPAQDQGQDDDDADLGALLHDHSLPRAALRAIVPQGMAQEGLADWESAMQLSEGAEPATWLRVQRDFYGARQTKRARNAVVFESLVEGYERGQMRGGREGEDERGLGD
ncbi:uncharacterized protein C8A04DRAFT_28109 [Dichotomopilus funicola]|uniref:Uncharacterized protein n=1 Tax=Dichotomopilus funicola TaxID=1934379 RepID=A0AAN6V3M7_9PEZI|nr:hypothetical protein C8A04DRAFT_28109 [Dichotomopilus funicola]